MTMKTFLICVLTASIALSAFTPVSYAQKDLSKAVDEQLGDKIGDKNTFVKATVKFVMKSTIIKKMIKEYLKNFAAIDNARDGGKTQKSVIPKDLPERIKNFDRKQVQELIGTEEIPIALELVLSSDLIREIMVAISEEIVADEEYFQ